MKNKRLDMEYYQENNTMLSKIFEATNQKTGSSLDPNSILRTLEGVLAPKGSSSVLGAINKVKKILPSNIKSSKKFFTRRSIRYKFRPTIEEEYKVNEIVGVGENINEFNSDPDSDLRYNLQSS